MIIIADPIAIGFAISLKMSSLAIFAKVKDDHVAIPATSTTFILEFFSFGKVKE